MFISKNKIFLKRLVLSVVIVSIILVSFAGCGNNDDSDYSDDDYVIAEDNDVNNEGNDDAGNDDNIGNDEQDDNVVNSIDDDVIELKSSDAYFIDAVCHEYGQKDSEDFFGLAFVNENDIVQLIERSKTIAIYTAYDSVKFVPVISEAKYTVGYDFEDGIDYDTDHVKVSAFPNIITGGIVGLKGQPSPYSSYAFSELTQPGHPIEECNGMSLKDFMAENGKEYFVRSSGYYYSHLYMDAELNETFTFGGYIGTEWVEESLTADVKYYEIDGAVKIESERTKDGYFTLDCSELNPGLYYVIEFNTFVNVV